MAYLRVRELLTPEQRLTFTGFQDIITDWELGSFYTFSLDDLKIINQHRRDYNKLGFAVLLCSLRYPGWPISRSESIPQTLLKYISKQLNINCEVFPQYFQRDATRLEHLDEIRQRYGYRNFTIKEYKNLLLYLQKEAMNNGKGIYLINLALDELRKYKVIYPAISTIERAVWEARKYAEDKIYKIINRNITDEQRSKLDNLLQSSEDKFFTQLAWLREIPDSHKPEAFVQVINRLEYIRQLQLNINQGEIHNSRLAQLSRIGEKYEPYAFRKFPINKRYAILAVYLLDLSQELVDQAIEIHDRQMNFLLSKGRREQEEMHKQNGKSINEKVVHYASLIKALIKARTEKLDPYNTIETMVMPWDKLVSSCDEADKLARPIEYDYLDLLAGRYLTLRKYTPFLLKGLKFHASQSSVPLLEALKTIHESYESKKRKLPENSPVDFIPNRWLRYVIEEDGNLNKSYYEMAAFTELRNHIRSGDISVEGSRQYRDFNEYLVAKEVWDNSKTSGNIGLGVNISPKEFMKERMESLLNRINWIGSNKASLEGVSLEDGEIHLKRLEKDTPEEARAFSLLLYGMLPRIKLSDLLLEVSNWTMFENQFIHASTGKTPKEEEKPIIIACLMAMGTNMGLLKMAESTLGISYHQMANVSQWRMYDDAMIKAQAELVNFHHKLKLPFSWGDGTTSSSDGMRVQIAVPSLNAEHNPHYGSGRGATIYRFVSDQNSSYYVQVINTNARDANHLVDGFLNHETDLNIEEHYTDTAGYTDQTFGLCHLLGFRFAPRIRDISELKLYSFGKSGDFPNLNNILQGKINEKVILENYDDVLRLAHSIKVGKVSASLIMARLGSYARNNSLSNALREIGRIEKTIFILDYISDEALRRRIQKGLNKGELANALARAVFFAKRGEFYERALKDQLQRASALNIIINAISVWNTVYLQKAIEYLKGINALKEELVSYISPFSWEHINFYGQYKFDLNNVTNLDSLRPLNIDETKFP